MISSRSRDGNQNNGGHHGNYDPILTVLDKLECVTPSGEGKWMARCPAHDDGRPSLQVASGDNGNCLAKCYAGCSLDAITEAIGMKPAELFADFGQKRYQEQQPAKRSSRIVATFDYRDEGGNLGYQIRRTESKDFFQYRPDGRGGWITGLGDTRRLLYRLPELLAADPVDVVFVVEGEKDVHNLTKLGLVATTKSGGANGKWLPEFNDHFRGRQVVVIPDHDEPGRTSADSICRQLKNVAKSLKLLDLSHYWEGMPVKGDVSDWIEKTGGDRSQLLELVDKTPGWEFEDIEMDDAVELDDVGELLLQDPFPLASLPYEWGLIASNVAEAMNVDPSGVGVLMLSIVSGVVGGTAKMRGKPGWEEPCALWCVLAADSGSGKTPVIDFLKAPIDDIDYENIMAWRKRYSDWKAQSEQYQQAKRKKTGVPDDITEPGPEPQCPRLGVQDATVESLVPLLGSNEAGLMLINDELSGWLTSFGGYNKGRAAADLAFWNQSHSGTSGRNDRKGAGCTFLRRPTMSVCGGVQPAMMAQTLSSEHRSSGLLARVLVAWPPRRIVQWSDRELGWGTKEDYKQLIMRLMMFRRSRVKSAGDFLGVDYWQGESNLTGEVDPMVFEFASDAQQRFIEYFNQLGLEAGELTGDLASAWAKLRGMTLRVALVLHLAEWAAGKESEPSQFVSLESLESAIRIIDWLKTQTRKLYTAFASNDPAVALKRQVQDQEAAETDWLKKKIRDRGGEIKLSEFATNMKLKASRLKRTLGKLEADGCGKFENRRSASGPPSKWFVLNSQDQLSGNPQDSFL
ncbi:YfjI family protein [Lacunimicrobium album]